MLLKFHQTYNIGDPRVNHSRDLDSLLMSSPPFPFLHTSLSCLARERYPNKRQRKLGPSQNRAVIIASPSPIASETHEKPKRTPYSLGGTERLGVETLWRKLCRECEPEEKTRICKGRAECWELALAVVEDQEERRKGDKVAPPSLACETWGGGLQTSPSVSWLSACRLDDSPQTQLERQVIKAE
jgi:hypothetical protein